MQRENADLSATTDSTHGPPLFPSLYRNTIPVEPDRVWVADVTYVRLAVGFAYLAVILDACSRRVVGYAIARHMTARLTFWRRWRRLWKAVKRRLA